jgi:hypothetical protein
VGAGAEAGAVEIAGAVRVGAAGSGRGRELAGAGGLAPPQPTRARATTKRTRLMARLPRKPIGGEVGPTVRPVPEPVKFSTPRQLSLLPDVVPCGS